MPEKLDVKHLTTEQEDELIKTNPIYSRDAEPPEDGELDLRLWNADPNCNHLVESQPSGGVKCVKCGGWYCF